MNRTSRRHRVFLLTGIISACALAAAACSSSSSPTASSSSKPGKVTLVVYSAQGYDKVMTAAFSKATGIPVKLDDNSTGPLLTQIEASKNNPNWGLLWVDGATAFAGLDQQGLLQKGFEPNVTWDSLGQQSVPSDKSYTHSGVTQGEHYYQQLKTNGLIIHPTNGPTLQALTSGQIKLALVQSSAGVGAA